MIAFENFRWKKNAEDLKIGDIIRLENDWKITSIVRDDKEDGWEYIQAHRVLKDGSLGRSYLSAGVGFKYFWEQKRFRFHRTRK